MCSRLNYRPIRNVIVILTLRVALETSCIEVLKCRPGLQGHTHATLQSWHALHIFSFVSTHSRDMQSRLKHILPVLLSSLREEAPSKTCKLALNHSAEPGSIHSHILSETSPPEVQRDEKTAPVSVKSISLSPGRAQVLNSSPAGPLCWFYKQTEEEEVLEEYPARVTRAAPGSRLASRARRSPEGTETVESWRIWTRTNPQQNQRRGFFLNLKPEDQKRFCCRSLQHFVSAWKFLK